MSVLTGPLFKENTPEPPRQSRSRERRYSRSRGRSYSRSSNGSDERQHSLSRSGSWDRNDYGQSSSSSHSHNLYSEDQSEESDVEGGSDDFDQSCIDLESAKLLRHILNNDDALLYTILVEDDPWLTAGMVTVAFF